MVRGAASEFVVGGAAWGFRTVFAVTGDASKAVALIAARITFNFVLMVTSCVFIFSPLPVGRSASGIVQDYPALPEVAAQISCLHQFDAVSRCFSVKHFQAVEIDERVRMIAQNISG